MPSQTATKLTRFLFDMRYSAVIAAGASAVVILVFGGMTAPVHDTQEATPSPSIPRPLAETPAIRVDSSETNSGAAGAEPEVRVAVSGTETAIAPVPVRQGVLGVFSGAEQVAPLRIQTALGDAYYVKLVHAQSGEPLMTFFVQGGQTYETRVPLGKVRIRYASGTTWYGEKELFGPNTSYSQADEVFNFERDEGGRVSGYTVELIKQVNGNLSTSSIPPSEF